MKNRFGETIDGYELGEWLEDDGNLSRYTVENDHNGADSVWICIECDHVDDECICDDDLDFDEEENYYDDDLDLDEENYYEPSELDEWVSFDPYC